MKLRIYRTWDWVLDCSPLEVRYGGDNPMKLEATDTLQYMDNNIWTDVKIVDAGQPEHPKELKRQKRMKEMTDALEQTWKDIKFEPFKRDVL